jgi:Zn-dependent protease
MILTQYLQLDSLLFRLAAFLAAIVLHEFAHAAAARLLGDPTPRDAGRLTLLPFPHMDTLGLAMVLFGPFGWGKSVPLQEERFRQRKGAAVAVHLAGPAANLAAGIVLWWLYFNLPYADPVYDGTSRVIPAVAKGLLQYGFIVNLMLAMIHLLPVYPFDGWRILRSLAPGRWLPACDKYERPGLAVAIALMVTPFGQNLLQQAYQILVQGIIRLF